MTMETKNKIGVFFFFFSFEEYGFMFLRLLLLVSGWHAMPTISSF